MEPGRPTFSGRVDQSEEMLDRAVDASVRQQAHQMQFATRSAHVLEAGEQNGILRKGAVGKRFVDDDDALRNDASAAHVEVSDFAVPHDAGRQPNVLAAGCKR